MAKKLAPPKFMTAHDIGAKMKVNPVLVRRALRTLKEIPKPEGGWIFPEKMFDKVAAVVTKYLTGKVAKAKDFAKAKEVAKAAKPAKAVPVPAKTIVKAPVAASWTPHWCFPSAAKARREADAKAKSMGADPGIFAVAQQGGKWAIIPCHHAAEYGAVLPPPLALKKGMVVCDMTIMRRKGKLVAIGPQVSEVKWFDGKMAAGPYVSNVYLRLAE